MIKAKGILGRASAVVLLLLASSSMVTAELKSAHPFDPPVPPPIYVAPDEAPAAEEQVDTEVSESRYTDERDPWERGNRAVFRFNTAVDKALFRPLARGYRAIMPDLLEQGVTNFFSNINDVTSAVNNALQGRGNAMFSDLSRVIINSTLGLLGFIDVASMHGIPKRGEDLGQTLGVWGFEPGPYIVLPFLGPSSGRDFVGIVGDFFLLDPLLLIEDDATLIATISLRYLDRRAGFLTATDIAEQAALDPYIFYREAYFQRRASQVNESEAGSDF